MKQYRILYDIKSLEKVVARTFMRDACVDIEKMKNFPTPTQIQIIEYIIDADKVVYQRELEQVLNLRRATVSGVLQTMEKNHLIERIPSKTDARMKQIILNPKTKELFLNQKKKIEQLEKLVVTGISEAELESFVHVLAIMKQNVDEYAANIVCNQERR